MSNVIILLKTSYWFNTCKKISNPILIKGKINQIENIQNIKNNVIGPTSKYNPCHVLNKKETNMGCDFLNKDVLKPLNGTNRNENHLNVFVPLMKENPTSTTPKKPWPKKWQQKYY